MQLQRTHAIVILVVATLVAAGTIVYALTVSQKISTSGTVKGVGIGIYWDSNFTQKVTSISWGQLDPGQSKSVYVYVRNEGNVAVNMSMTTGNWNPASASSYITLSWNRGGSTLAPGASVQATLTLAVSSGVTGISSFSFDITITGTG